MELARAAALMAWGFCVGALAAAAQAWCEPRAEAEPEPEPEPAREPTPTARGPTWMRQLRATVVGQLHVAVADPALVEAACKAMRQALPRGAGGEVRLARGTHRELRAARHRVATGQACLVVVERRKRGPVQVSRSGQAGPFPAVSLLAAGARATAHAVVASAADPSLPAPLNDPSLFRGRPIAMDWSGRVVELTL